MKVSVIVPCYKFADYIGECLSSILIQKTNFDFEILIRDDFSNDGSEEIISNFALRHPKVKHFKATENWGFHKNIKFLLEQSNADYIAYVDGDDYWIDDRKLKTQIDYLDSNLDYSMCFCGYWNQQNLDKSSLHLKSWYGPNFDDIDEFLPSHFIMTNPVNSLTRVFRNIKGIFKDYFFECHINDLPLNYELSKVGKIKFLNFPAGVYRVHDNNISNFLKTNFSNNEVLTLLNKTKELMLNNK
jgi:glycosyltransferase involved in cell wall biosynthesis